MGKVRDLVAALPGIVMVRDADRIKERNLMLFDYEVASPNSVYAHREGDEEWKRRLMPMEIPAEFIRDESLETYRFGMDLLALAAVCHRHRKMAEAGVEIPESETREVLERTSDLEERGTWKENRAVSEIMTAEVAVMVWWNE